MKLKSIKLTLLALFSFFGLSTLFILPTYAEVNCNDTNIPAAVREAAGCDSTTTDDTALPKVIINILNAIIGVSGLIAVIFIVIGGVQYMISSGDPGKIKKAKDTILYAIIGLIICVLAFAIVNFAIKNILKL